MRQVRSRKQQTHVIEVSIMKVVPLLQLTDNYAYLVIDEPSREAGVVDCAEADSVLAAAEREQVELKAILPTHHHYDHVAGNADLLAARPDLRVYGADTRIPGLTTMVEDGDRIRMGSLEARVLFVPAHTSGHVAYYFEQQGALFTGDTLFAGGCGRLFEGDAAMMFVSLSKLCALPDETRVYFGHEYTETNLRFALTLEPGNDTLRKKYEWAVECNRKHEPTTPTTVASEKETNPFFRWHSPELRESLRPKFPDLPMDDLSVFAKIRALKDVF
jgi:hydroxyacylglutathione hydrolase